MGRQARKQSARATRTAAPPAAHRQLHNTPPAPHRINPIPLLGWLDASLRLAVQYSTTDKTGTTTTHPRTQKPQNQRTIEPASTSGGEGEAVVHGSLRAEQAGRGEKHEGALPSAASVTARTRLGAAANATSASSRSRPAPRRRSGARCMAWLSGSQFPTGRRSHHSSVVAAPPQSDRNRSEAAAGRPDPHALGAMGGP